MNKKQLKNLIGKKVSVLMPRYTMYVYHGQLYEDSFGYLFVKTGTGELYFKSEDIKAILRNNIGTTAIYL